MDAGTPHRLIPVLPIQELEGLVPSPEGTFGTLPFPFSTRKRSFTGPFPDTFARPACSRLDALTHLRPKFVFVHLFSGYNKSRRGGERHQRNISYTA